MKIANLSNHRTDLVRIEFNNGRVIYIDLPSNIANAEYRNDVICRWVEETFHGVFSVGIDIDTDRKTLTNAMCIRVYPSVHDAYNIYILWMTAVKGELNDETIEKIDKFLEQVNRVSQWVNE